MTTYDKHHPHCWHDLLSHMLEGVQEAIVDVSYRHGRYTATEGKLEKTDISGSQYTFRLADDWEPAANARVLIALDTNGVYQTVAGTLLAVVDNFITLVTETPLPKACLKKISLVEDSSWLLHRLQDTLTRLQAQGEVAAHMGSQVFGFYPSRKGYGTQQVQISSFQPNADQARAITLGIESGQVMVIGPPGTGKTSTEGVLFIEHLHVGKTVLVAAHTNTALDTVMKRLKEYCEQSENTSLIESHQLVRLGTSVDLIGEAYQDITLQGILTQRLGELAQERDHLQQELSKLRETLAQREAALQAEQNHWRKERSVLQNQYETLQQERIVLEQQEQQRLVHIATRLAVVQDEQKRKQHQLHQEKDILQQMVEALAIARAKQAQSEQMLLMKKSERETFRQYSLLSRFLSRIHGKTEQTLLVEEQHCQRQVEQTRQAVNEQEQLQKRVLVQKAETAYQINQLREEMQKLQNAQQMHTNEAKRINVLAVAQEEIEQELQQGDSAIQTMAYNLSRLEASRTSINSRLSVITNKQHGMTLEIIKEARLIGTTLSGLTTNPYLQDRLFDAVVIDEASMASLPLILVAATHATRHVAIFGDPNQLDPIIPLTSKKETQAAAYWLGTNIFSHLRVKLEDAEKKANRVVFLSEQARMHPAIAAPISHMIYGGRLKNRQESQRAFLQLAPHPEWPLMIVDTGDVDQGKMSEEPRVCQTRQSSHGKSKYNLYHVKCVVQLVRLLLPQFLEKEKPQIGIITPYRLQKIHISKELKKQGLLHLVHVGTVHSFQSVEYPCIIFDTTEGYDIRIGQFTSNSWGQDGIPSAATRLLNVAHTRARDKLIYIANVGYIQQGGYRKEHLLTRLVNYVVEQGCMASSTLFKDGQASNRA